MKNHKDSLSKIELEELRKLYEHFFEYATTRYLPNLKEIQKGSEKFDSFMRRVKTNPELLGDDDSATNEALLDYLSEYSFAAFGIGFALGKLIDKDTDAFEEHIKAAMQKD
ncbi:MAG: hypothetical protein IKF64_05595 [Eubacterium sp.]|nr:hypothetical protein [Eubacterium sp.]